MRCFDVLTRYVFHTDAVELTPTPARMREDQEEQSAAQDFHTALQYATALVESGLVDLQVPPSTRAPVHRQVPVQEGSDAAGVLIGVPSQGHLPSLMTQTQ